jgi:putative sterol carrier protein
LGKPEITDPDQIFEFHKRLVEKLLEFEDITAAFSGENEQIGIYITDPDVRLRLVIKGADTHLIKVDPGDETQDDPRLIMKWKTALKFWQGNLDIMGALLSGAVKVEGQNMDPLFRLKSVVYRAKDASVEVAKELGWE